MSAEENSNKKQIVVLGAGFGGIRVALDVAKKSSNSRVILIDARNYHLYHPALYEIATAVRADETAIQLKSTIAVPLSDIIRRYKNIVFKQSVVSGIDPDHRLVRTDDGDVYYDYLVAALGSTTDFYGIPGLRENSITLKSFEDAITIRNRVADSLAQYALTRDESYLNFVIGGGGFTGVEFAGELTNYLKHLVRQSLGTLPVVSVWVIEGSAQLLSGLPPKVGALARTRLEKLGVKVRLNSRIVSVDDSKVVINGNEEFPTKTVIWTGGVRAKPPVFVKNIACDKKDRVVVNSRLNLDLYPEIFAIGDSSYYQNPSTGQALPQTAQVATHQAKYVADAIARSLSGKDILPYRPKTSWPFLVPLSGKYAMMVTKNGIFAGIGMYIIRRFADLRYFLSILPFRKAFSFWFKGSVVYLKND